MTIDLLYVSFNRLAYTRETFPVLLANTDWQHVARLFLADDASIDGTADYLADACVQLPDHVNVTWHQGPTGGPTAAANWYLDHATPGVETVGKIDNDTVVPAGWLPELLRLLEEHPEVDLLGMAPDLGPPQPCPYAERTIRLVPFVDGNGLWRHRAFARNRPIPGASSGRFGFTEWQRRRRDLVKARAAPDLPMFQLDGLPFEPWLSLASDYVACEWQRYWPPMAEDATGYWQWWLDAR